MKKLSMYALASAVALALGATAPAMAEEGGDNNGYRHHDPIKAKVRVRKDREVLEAVFKYTGVLVASYGVIVPDGAAESDGIVEQYNVKGDVNHDHGVEGDPNPLNLDADIIGSVNDNAGVVQLNQDAGNMVNQGNVASVAVTGSETAVTDATSAAEQLNKKNGSDTTVPLDIGNLNKDGVIEDSINGNSGIIHVNQNTGDMNNQLNVTTAAFGEGAVVALADSELGQFNTSNTVFDTNSQKRDLISGSVNGNTGIVNVNQSSGKFNNQATIVSFSGSASIN